MSEAQKCERFSIEILPIFGETPAPPKPCERSFDDPPLREENKSFCVIGTLDDLHIHPRHYFCHGAAKQRALIAAPQQHMNAPISTAHPRLGNLANPLSDRRLLRGRASPVNRHGE